MPCPWICINSDVILQEKDETDSGYRNSNVILQETDSWYRNSNVILQENDETDSWYRNSNVILQENDETDSGYRNSNVILQNDETDSWYRNSNVILQEKDETDSGYRSGTIPDEKLPHKPSDATLNKEELRRRIAEFNRAMPGANFALVSIVLYSSMQKPTIYLFTTTEHPFNKTFWAKDK